MNEPSSFMPVSVDDKMEEKKTIGNDNGEK
jgi:hypothetical protein